MLPSSFVALTLMASACGASTVGDARSDGASSSSTAAPVESTEAAPSSSTTAQPATSAEEPTTTATPDAPAANNFPDLTVTDVASGEPVNLRSLGGSGTPVAMWFYYPH